MTALWIHEVADRFWHDATGAPAGFLRDLRDAVAWALPVMPVEVPGLSIQGINGWLAQRGLLLQLTIPDRSLRAAIVVHEANGILFIDPDDAEDERRFSLAHEIAHYLIEYALPHERARQRLGPGIVPVLQGKSAASSDERIGALLSGITLDASLHLMERTADGHLPGRDVSGAERHADALAYELLAPADELRTMLVSGMDVARIEATLRQTFGLPGPAASSYAQLLIPEPTAGSLFRRLFSTA